MDAFGRKILPRSALLGEGVCSEAHDFFRGREDLQFLCCGRCRGVREVDAQTSVALSAEKLFMCWREREGGGMLHKGIELGVVCRG